MTITIISDKLLIGNWQDAAIQLSWPGRIIKVLTVAFDSPIAGDYKYGLVDGPANDNDKMLFYAINELERMINDGDTVLVHCVSGISRSSAVVVGYLMKSRNIDYGEAYKYLQSLRPEAKIVPYFEDILSKGMWEDIVKRFEK